ncbi:uncharacterized protein si:ch211-214j24.14 [Clinocottus analis]|uniref:uncharacterized protein si:ch211-214j24.14 n=1 Tax=Clinocottus analis TaxID=304258 RepID=UPI0035BFFF8D
MGDVDPEDPGSLDGSAEENHSDMVHLEREEAEEEEEGEDDDDDEELQTSALSILGGERELGELSEEEHDLLQAPETEALLVSAEDPKRPAEFRQVVPPMALPLLPIVKLDPPSTTSTPVPSTLSSEAEELYSTRGLQPPSILAQAAAAAEEPPSERRVKFSQIPLSDAEEHSDQSSEETTGKATAPKTTPKPLSSAGLLCGGAALVAVVGVVAYGAVAFCRK